MCFCIAIFMNAAISFDSGLELHAVSDISATSGDYFDAILSTDRHM